MAWDLQQFPLQPFVSSSSLPHSSNNSQSKSRPYLPPSAASVARDHDFGAFEAHTLGFGSRLLRQMGWKGERLGKHEDGVLNPIKPARDFRQTFLLGHHRSLQHRQSQSSEDEVKELPATPRRKAEPYIPDHLLVREADANPSSHQLGDEPKADGINRDDRDDSSDESADDVRALLISGNLLACNQTEFFHRCWLAALRDFVLPPGASSAGCRLPKHTLEQQRVVWSTLASMVDLTGSGSAAGLSVRSDQEAARGYLRALVWVLQQHLPQLQQQQCPNLLGVTSGPRCDGSIANNPTADSPDDDGAEWWCQEWMSRCWQVLHPSPPTEGEQDSSLDSQLAIEHLCAAQRRHYEACLAAGRLRPLTGLPELLADLRRAGTKVAVVSLRARSVVQQELQALGLDRLTDAVVTGSNLLAPEPGHAGGLWKEALTRLRPTMPHNCLAVVGCPLEVLDCLGAGCGASLRVLHLTQPRTQGLRFLGPCRVFTPPPEELRGLREGWWVPMVRAKLDELITARSEGSLRRLRLVEAKWLGEEAVLPALPLPQHCRDALPSSTSSPPPAVPPLQSAPLSKCIWWCVSCTDYQLHRAEPFWYSAPSPPSYALPSEGARQDMKKQQSQPQLLLRILSFPGAQQQLQDAHQDWVFVQQPAVPVAASQRPPAPPLP